MDGSETTNLTSFTVSASDIRIVDVAVELDHDYSVEYTSWHGNSSINNTGDTFYFVWLIGCFTLSSNTFCDECMWCGGLLYSSCILSKLNYVAITGTDTNISICMYLSESYEIAWRIAADLKNHSLFWTDISSTVPRASKDCINQESNECFWFSGQYSFKQSASIYWRP